MTVAIANVNTNNTFDYWRTTTNQIANAMSNIVVTTNANVATGNAIINGYFTANGIIANTITINGGSGVVNVATGNVTSNVLVSNVGTFTTLTTATLNVTATSTFANLSVNNFTAVSAANITNLTVTSNTVTGNISANSANLTSASIPTLTANLTALITALTANTITVNNTIKIGNTASNVTISGPNTTQQGGTYWLNGNGVWSTLPAGLAVGGSNTQVEFNDSGVLAGSAGLTFDKTTLNLGVGNVVTAVTGNYTTINATTVAGVSVTANTMVTNNTIKVGNTAANITISGPNTTQQGGSYYLNGNGSWSIVSAGLTIGGSNTQVQFNDSGALGGSSGLVYDKTASNLTVANTITANIHINGNNATQQIYFTTSGASSQQIDSFLIANYRAAKYIISMSNTSTNSYLVTELLVLHNGGAVQTTEYAMMVSNTIIGSFTTSINATAVSVNVTPTLTTTTVNMQRTLMAA